MNRASKSYADLMEMAKRYNVNDNALFIQAVKQYSIQQSVIDMINEEIAGGDLTTQKSYIAGQSNDYASPLVKELPKHSDSANKTASMILDIIVKLGHETKEEDDDGFDCE